MSEGSESVLSCRVPQFDVECVAVTLVRFLDEVQSNGTNMVVTKLSFVKLLENGGLADTTISDNNNVHLLFHRVLFWLNNKVKAVCPVFSFPFLMIIYYN